MWNWHFNEQHGENMTEIWAAIFFLSDWTTQIVAVNLWLWSFRNGSIWTVSQTSGELSVLKVNFCPSFTQILMGQTLGSVQLIRCFSIIQSNLRLTASYCIGIDYFRRSRSVWVYNISTGALHPACSEMDSFCCRLAAQTSWDFSPSSLNLNHISAPLPASRNYLNFVPLGLYSSGLSWKPCSPADGAWRLSLLLPEFY